MTKLKSAKLKNDKIEKYRKSAKSKQSYLGFADNDEQDVCEATAEDEVVDEAEEEDEEEQVCPESSFVTFAFLDFSTYAS